MKNLLNLDRISANHTKYYYFNMKANIFVEIYYVIVYIYILPLYFCLFSCLYKAMLDGSLQIEFFDEVLYLLE